jgi:histidinol phosphatase-like enzyme
VCRCECRKPKPGLLERIIDRLGLERRESWMIGDTAADAGAARAAGVKLGLLMQSDRCELCQYRGGEPVGAAPDACAPSLEELARAVIAG